MFSRTLLTCVGIATATFVAAIAGTANAQEKFPSRPVHIIVPFSPGASTDYIARALGQKISETWNVPVIVENRAGAGGNIAADYVVKAPADGYTILLAGTGIINNPTLFDKPEYVPKQLQPLGIGVNTLLVTVSSLSFPAKTPKDIVAYSKAKPGSINYASAGIGTLSQLGMEMFALNNQIKMNHIPYRGSSGAIGDIAGGQSDLLIDTIASAAPQILAGKVNAVAVHTAQRHPTLPNVPTFTELGFKDMEFSTWSIFFVPAGTPAEPMRAIEQALKAALQKPDVLSALSERGLEPIVKTQPEMEAFMKTEAVRWNRVIKEANVKPQ